MCFVLGLSSCQAGKVKVFAPYHNFLQYLRMGNTISLVSRPKMANTIMLCPKFNVASRKDSSTYIPDICSMTSVQIDNAIP